ncbi:MAG TPA: VWA domain-containing protein [Pyrinomonadaceae bacterium]|jgi:VWFA-related protein|nr:VWA domain-containing protein [Pyrinomonadaceae bacterium]
MKKHVLRASVLFFALAAVSFAQKPDPSPTPQDDEVVKITSKIVQVDAVVTDKDGNQITDLSRDDFEILQDGKPQKIVGFSYVNVDTSQNIGLATTQRSDKNLIQPPPVKGHGLGRIITFVVDDGNCSASQSGMFSAREALQKFVNEQMLPTDLVAIYQTRSGSSVLQQYSSDKQQLLRAARRIRWYPPTGGCASSDGSFFEAARSNTFQKMTPGGGTETAVIESEADRKTREGSEDFGKNNQVVGTVGVLRYVVRGLERVGGRKIVFFMSDGMPFRSRDGQVLSAVDSLRDLTDLANRNSVIFNTIDVRGVMNTIMIEARDEVSTSGEADVNASDKIIANRTRDVRNSQEGMAVLADQTGGRFYHDSNFLEGPIRKALSLEKGYYLLAYQPADDTFKGKNFNALEIRLKRPDLKINSRAGFIGFTTDNTATKKRTGDSELYDAIAAPLPKAGLNLQLTSFFGNSAAEGNFVRSLFHLQGDEITFVDDGNLKKAIFDVVAVTLNEKNEVVDEFTRTHTFRIESAAIPLIKQNGLVYSTDVPIKKPGTYNFRVAVRDGTSRMLGTASQVIQIPDLRKGKLFLSGLTVAQVDANGKFSIPGSVKPENALSLIASTAVPGVRQFRKGSILAYAYTIYNAKLDNATNQPKLSIQVNLYKDGNVISEGKPQTADLEKQADLSRINDYGYLRLNPTIEPGDYAVQIIVKDLSEDGKNAMSSQWVDFEVIE